MNATTGLGSAALLALTCGFAPHPASAQIKTDGMLGARADLKGPHFQINEDLGKLIGDNLFHSFEQFNIRTLADGTIESATFRGANDIANVLSRVTGTSPSEINGLLRSEVGNADVWFINPNGITFGPNARLDVPGSFHVSTADELRFPDGAVFSATDPDASSLTVAPPKAFGFLGPSSAPILVDRSKLEVPAREAFSLVGGDIIVGGGGDGAPIGGEAGTLRATAGEITLAAVGEDDAGINLDRAFIDTTGDGGGTISIRGGRLLVHGNSKVLADNIGSTDAVGGIEIEADSVEVSSGSITTRTLSDRALVARST